MEENKLKNMVVLRNLPSNLVEEAFVVLKANKKVKKLEKIEKAQNSSNNKTASNKKDYILKEAEMLVQNYISKIEEKEKKQGVGKNKTNIKYRRLKNYAYLSSLIMLIETLMIIIK